MVSLKEMLLYEQNRLEIILQKTSERLENAPEGSLRITKTRKWTQYYHQTSGKDKKRKYISKSKQTFIRNLAQKSYDEKIFNLVAKRLSQIKKITKDYDDEEIEKIFLSEHSEKQKLIQPVELPWNEQLKQWISMEYNGKEFQEGTPVIMTERGERIRSKSEKILADYFYRNGILYKYECPLYLKYFGTIYPDFTFLSKKTKKEIYWEHNGKMDDPIYCQSAIRKLQAYEENGIYPGERLLLTFETNKIILDTKLVKRLVDRYLI